MSGPTDFQSDVLADLISKLMDGHVKYDFGEKTSQLTAPENIKGLDCSGFTDYVFFKITKPSPVDLPAGTKAQNTWFSERYPKVPYDDAAKKDGTLRIAFRYQTKKRAGHVWFTINGVTLECTTAAHNNGPCSLTWDRRRDEVDACYELGRLVPTRLDTAWIPVRKGVP